MTPRAKKGYGQHFLIDEHTSESIAKSLSLVGYDAALEVGPGKGMLTKYLLSLPLDLKAVEADPDMVIYLRKHFGIWADEQLLAADFMRLPLDNVFGERAFALIGNFPYNISSQIVFRMIEARHQIPELVGMFQYEMAERVISPPGSKAYGVISVLTQAFYEGEMLFKVSPDKFLPPPRVQSAVIRLRRKAHYEQLGCDYQWLRRVVKLAFSQRRKMLRNTMKSFLKGDELLKQEFFTRRPEQLPLADFVQLANWVEETVSGER